jgi:GNAT superfamily N-acetyltransferase
MDTVMLRAASHEDEAFLFDTYCTTLRPHVEWAWGWDDERQSEGFRRHHPLEQFQVIAVNGDAVGGWHLETQAAAHYLWMLFLLPAWQGQGIATRLLTDAHAQARAQRLPLQLRVIKSNRGARRLYDRLGFVVLDEDKASWRLEWR